MPLYICGPVSSVGIVTGYGLDGPGIESWCGRDFHTCPDRPWGPPSLLYNGYQVFPGGVNSGRDVTPSNLLVPWSKKSTAIPLLPLWAIRPVQSLSACTRVHFSFTSVCIQLYTSLDEACSLYTALHLMLSQTKLFLLKAAYVYPMTVTPAECHLHISFQSEQSNTGRRGVSPPMRQVAA